MLQRKPALVADGNVPFLRTNITVPRLHLHRDTLYFFPDRIFVRNPEGIGAVSYANFQVAAKVGRFIEDGPVPRDATQVATTWRFVNKNGGPDRRFANNRILPILAYQDVLFASETGVRGYLQVSRSDGADEFLRALNAIRHVQAQPEAATVVERGSSILPASSPQPGWTPHGVRSDIRGRRGGLEAK